MKNKILNTYKRNSDYDLLGGGYRIVEKMDSNPTFINPPGALELIKKLLPDLQASVNKAKGRDMEMVAIKNNKRAALIVLLTELADYVTLTCNGDRALLLSSGFEISGEKSDQPQAVIEKLEVELGPPGEVTTRLKRVPGARAYIHQYSNDPQAPNTGWTSEGSSHRSYTFKGLNSTVKYWFRVVAIGPAGQQVFSPVVPAVIQ